MIKNFEERIAALRNFAVSNKNPVKMQVEFDESVTKIKDINKFIDTLKMLPFASNVENKDGKIQFLVTTDESQVGISEQINQAIRKVATNVVYQITEITDKK